MNETEIKTRQGLILESVLAAALTEAGFSFAHDVQYDESCEKPDFLIPNKKNPKIMVETHQTEARDSFRMKVLRAFTAVTESKAYFGNALVSVNVLFGDPDNELPPSNVKAMCGIFDLNIIPRRDATKPGLIQKLEAFSLSLAKKEGKATEKAAKEVVKTHGSAVTELARLIKSKITKAKARAELDDLWDFERTRVEGIGDAPKAGDPTYYKRCMLWSLFLDDSDFAELHTKQDPDLCSDRVKRQLVATKLATVEEEIDGDYYTLKPVFAAFLKDSDCLQLRSICKSVLDSIPSMKWHFEDIRRKERRVSMASAFFDGVKREGLASMLKRSINGDEIAGIPHSRAWIIDCLTRASGISLGKLSREIFLNGNNPGRLGDPVSHIVPRTERFKGMSAADRNVYVGDINNAMKVVCGANFLGTQSTDTETVAERLLELRVDGAIRLRKLDPLFLVASGICNSIGLKLEKISVVTIASDLAGQVAVGRFEVFGVLPSGGAKHVLLNTVAVHDNNGDHKSKEWGARRLATLYRIVKGKIRKSEYQEGVFVIDGEWKDKDVVRLHRSGWNHVVRLADLEQTLRSVFGLIKKKASPSSMSISMPDDGDDLLIAAEDE